MKYFFLAVGACPRSDDLSKKDLPQFLHHPRQTQITKAKNFYYCKLEDSPSHLRVWTAL